MCKFCILLLSLLFWNLSFCQKLETVYLDAKDSSSNFYIVIYPPKLPWSGFMFLIPGMYQSPQKVLQQTDLPTVAAEKGILTIIPVFKTGVSSIGIDSATQVSFLDILSQVKRKYKLIDLPFYLGGFSIGGSCAMKYTEKALNYNYPTKPSAVFAIDAPLDFERMYNTFQRELKFATTNSDLLEEIKYMLKRYDSEFGGSPSSFQANYHRESPYSYNDTTLQAIRPLINLPIRLYTEPDIKWWLKEGVDYYGMNAFDFAAITNDLTKLGSKKVSLIITTDKGYRKPDNRRNPHSWSIVDTDELVQWLLAQN